MKNNLSLKEALSDVKDYTNKTERERRIILDNVTPILQRHMSQLTNIEQAIMYYLVIPGGLKDSLTKKTLPEKLTNSFLSEKLREDSKSVSVYLKRLVDSGNIVREPINNKDYIYSIDNPIFIDWLKMRSSSSLTWELLNLPLSESAIIKEKKEDNMKKNIQVSYSEMWADHGEVTGEAEMNLETGVISNIKYTSDIPEDEIDAVISISVSIGGNTKGMPTIVYDVMPISEEEISITPKSLEDVNSWVETYSREFFFMTDDKTVMVENMLNKMINDWGWGDYCIVPEDMPNESKNTELTIGGLFDVIADVETPAKIWFNFGGNELLTLDEKSKKDGVYSFDNFVWGEGGEELLSTIIEKFYLNEFYTQDDPRYSANEEIPTALTNTEDIETENPAPQKP